MSVVWLVSAKMFRALSLGLLTFLFALLHWRQPAGRASSVFLDLTVGSPEPPRTERVFFEFADNPTDRVATQAERAGKEFCVTCYPGNTLSLFAWFCPLAILRSSFLPILSVCRQMNMFKRKSFLGWVSFHCPDSSSRVGLHGMVSFLPCVHETASLLCHLVPI